MNSRAVNRSLRRALAAGVLAVGVAGCGGGETDTGSGGSGEAAAGATASEAVSMVTSFAFHGPDNVEMAAVLDPAEITLSGGCTSGSPLSMGFRQGAPNSEGYFAFSFDSEKPVVAGQTGYVDLANVTWDNGTAPSTVAPDNPAMNAPRRMEGLGLMEIQTHSGVGMNGRMTAIVTGQVSGAGVEGAVPVEAKFDINLACARG